MPINIYRKDEGESVAWLCDSAWGLPQQIHELENWLTNNHRDLPKAEYIADIGFAGNEESKGGGCVISTEFMQLLTSSGIELWLSEYPVD